MYLEDGIQIRNYDEMKEKFNYEHVRQIILEDKQDNELNINRVGSVVDNANQRGTEITLQVIESSPTDLLGGEGAELFPNLFDNQMINLGQLRNFLKNEFAYQYEDVLVRIIDEATGKGKIPLDEEGEYELLLFCVLFAYLQYEPSDGDSVLFKQYLGLNPVQVALQGQKKQIKITESQTELPCYQPCAGVVPKLEWVVIQNDMQENVLVTLSGCPLRRHLDRGEEMLALTADGYVAAFLPRICTIQNNVVYQADDNLVIDDRRIQLNQEGALIAFTESKEYGYLYADRDGKLITKPQAGDPEYIRWLKGDVQDYGFLTPDGVYHGSLEMRGWNNLLLFDLSGKNSVALTAGRKAIDSRGHVLGTEIAAVSCCGENYVLLRMNGTVVIGKTGADQQEIPISSAHAVCADATGFWIAGDESLIRLGKDGSRNEESSYIIDEIERDNTGTTVFGLREDGSIQPLRSN